MLGLATINCNLYSFKYKNTQKLVQNPNFSFVIIDKLNLIQNFIYLSKTKLVFID